MADYDITIGNLTIPNDDFEVISFEPFNSPGIRSSDICRAPAKNTSMYSSIAKKQGLFPLYLRE